MAEHYGTTILPARPRKPKDKAKVEVAVQVAQRWILARLRDQRFFSLAELNAAIDQPALKPLPDEPYRFVRWKRCRVGPDYHVEADGHWYSVPFRLIRELVDVRIAGKTLELFYKAQRVASP